MKLFISFLAVVSVFLATFCQASHSDYGSQPKTAIVIASFGTTEPTALMSILNIKEKIEETFPQTPVALTFTSNIIRNVWQKRYNDKAFQEAHPEIPLEIQNVKGIIATIGDLQNQGYNTIIVQPTHMVHGEQFLDLKSYIDALASIKTVKDKYRPFHVLALGRPASGTIGITHDYNDDLHRLAVAMAGDIALARQNNSVLVYMAHGNEHMANGIYPQFQEVMRKMYPDVKTYVGAVEGFPGFDLVLDELLCDGVKKITLKPFMIVAGDHAINDMAGDEEDAWKVMLSQKGFEVIPVLQGIGSNDAVAKIFVDHIRDAAVDHEVILH